ncbi:prepilin peptidase [Cellulomonas oligotrophica]|uniref:prepilin peptidase n=1 Tax=Cellulomonas oligotrophica TaxID=931536 RepID=UPI00112C442D|nr:A24 family peptidase [Cellulomonas oligotrophica]
MTPLLVTLAGVLGLLVGSFLNVVVWRVPRGESVVAPPSACPACGARIRPYDNVPVVSWLVLRGRCRDCAAPISARYPAVELLTGVAFAAVAWWSGPGWWTPALLYLVAITVALTAIDLDVHRLPDAIVLPSYPVAAALLVLASADPGGTADWGALLRAGVGAAALFAFYFVLLVAYPAGMGFGDVKLAGVLGLYLGWVGWGALVVGAFAAFLVGGVVGLALIARRRAGRRTQIAFGPWMLAGAWIGLVAGQPLWDGYLGLL